MRNISFEVSDDVYVMLQTVAAARGTTVETVARGGALSIARSWMIPLHQQIAQLVIGERLSDGEIAGETGLLRARVAKIRRDVLKLPANPEPPPARPQSPRSRKAHA